MTETFINHCIKMYESLDALSTDKELDSGKTVRVFIGSYMNTWKSTKISQTYYSPVKKALTRHGAIEVLQRGGRSTDTVIHLCGLPDTWEIDGWNDRVGLTSSTNYARLASEVEGIKKSLGGINVIAALQELEKRLVALEKSLSTERKTSSKPNKNTTEGV